MTEPKTDPASIVIRGPIVASSNAAAATQVRGRFSLCTELVREAWEVREPGIPTHFFRTAKAARAWRAIWVPGARIVHVTLWRRPKARAKRGK